MSYQRNCQAKPVSGMTWGPAGWISVHLVTYLLDFKKILKWKNRKRTELTPPTETEGPFSQTPRQETVTMDAEERRQSDPQSPGVGGDGGGHGSQVGGGVKGSEEEGRGGEGSGGRVKGSWSQQEDALLSQLVAQFGPRNWSMIARGIPGRSGKSCRLRWCNQLDPAVKRKPFTGRAPLWDEINYLLFPPFGL